MYMSCIQLREPTCTVYIARIHTWQSLSFSLSLSLSLSEDGEEVGGEGEEEEESEGEEGGGWDVGDDDLELPPDLVRQYK